MHKHIQTLCRLYGRRIVPQSLKPLQCQWIRTFSRISVTRSAMEHMSVKIAPSPMDKKMLVWGKMYKSIGDVPSQVSASKIAKARDLMRIRASLALIVLAFVSSMSVITYSRKNSSKDSFLAGGLNRDADLKEQAKQKSGDKK